MSSYTGPQPIVITPEHIIAAAQKIVNATDDAWEYSEAQILQSVESWLRMSVDNLLVEAAWHTNEAVFDFGTEYRSTQAPDSATELVVPPAPEWAHDTISGEPDDDDDWRIYDTQDHFAGADYYEGLLAGQRD